SPPAEKATPRQDQAGQASTGDGSGDAGSMVISDDFPCIVDSGAACWRWRKPGNNVLALDVGDLLDSTRKQHRPCITATLRWVPKRRCVLSMLTYGARPVPVAISTTLASSGT